MKRSRKSFDASNAPPFDILQLFSRKTKDGNQLPENVLRCILTHKSILGKTDEEIELVSSSQGYSNAVSHAKHIHGIIMFSMGNSI